MNKYYNNNFVEINEEDKAIYTFVKLDKQYMLTKKKVYSGGITITSIEGLFNNELEFEKYIKLIILK